MRIRAAKGPDYYERPEFARDGRVPLGKAADAMLTAAALDLDDRFEFHVERAKRPNREDVGERGQVGHLELVGRGGEIVSEPEVDRELLEQAPGDRRIGAETGPATGADADLARR